VLEQRPFDFATRACAPQSCRCQHRYLQSAPPIRPLRTPNVNAGQEQEQKLSPPENWLLYARICDQAFALSELARGLSSPTSSLAFLPRSSLGWLFVSLPALQFTEKAFALELLFQDPKSLIDVIFTNENFQSGFLSRLVKSLSPNRLLLASRMMIRT
jgi:hypothetical protein